MAQLSTGLDKHEVVLLGLFLALLRGDLTFVVQIRLVAHQHDNDIVSALGPDIVNPLPRVLERLCV